MITMGEALDDFTLADMLAGKATFTVVVLRARDASQVGKAYTYRVTQYESVNRAGETYSGIAVKVLTSASDATGRIYTYAGALSDAGRYRTTAGSKISESAPSIILFKWLCARLAARQSIDAVEILSMGTCLRCGQDLTAATSIKRRYGPVCAQKLGIA